MGPNTPSLMLLQCHSLLQSVSLFLFSCTPQEQPIIIEAHVQMIASTRSSLHLHLVITNIYRLNSTYLTSTSSASLLLSCLESYITWKWVALYKTIILPDLVIHIPPTESQSKFAASEVAHQCQLCCFVMFSIWKVCQNNNQPCK